MHNKTYETGVIVTLLNKNLLFYEENFVEN